ncbi:MAG TPA: type II toxin-antitoxin system VapB family antitoxin [Terriglobia bacterium]
MKTTVEMDERLLDKARRILGKETIKDTVEESLRRVVRQQALQDLVDSFGKVDLDLTPEKLKRMRRKRTHNASR